MTALTPSQPAAGHLVHVGEAFALTWSSVPADLSERVTPSQLRALVIVQGRDGIAVSELAKAMGVVPSSATRLCDRLVKTAMIERRPDPTNRRFHTLTLAPAGRRLLERLSLFRMLALDTTLMAMSAADRRHLHRGLAAFAEATCQA